MVFTATNPAITKTPHPKKKKINTRISHNNQKNQTSPRMLSRIVHQKARLIRERNCSCMNQAYRIYEFLQNFNPYYKYSCGL